MKKALLLLAAIGWMSSMVAQSDKRLKGIDTELNKVLKATKAPGFAVAVVQGNKIIYAKGFGYRDYENKIPVDANTLFAIGSSTKAFTSAVLGQLRKDEKLTFEDSPIKHIPQLKFFNNEMNDNISIKDLMCHRTGLPRHDMAWYWFPNVSKDSLLLRVASQEPSAGVKQKWQYNNWMFLTQGVVAERITGKSWEENIRERFFKPLGMTSSNVSIDEMKKSSNAAIGYELKKDSIISKMDYYNISGMSPAGAINSSVNDMSNWLITWINKGKFNDKEIIPEDYVTEAISSQMVIDGALPGKDNPDVHFSNYGYGWFLRSYKGHYRVDHGGNIDGFSADVTFFPSDKIGIVVLSNQNISSAPGMVRNIISDRMLGVNKTDMIKKFNEGQEKLKKAQKELATKKADTEKRNTKPSHDLNDYAGKYFNTGYGEFSITNEKDTLFINFKLKKYYLKHVHYDVFALTGVEKDATETLIRLNFLTNDAGDIASVKVKTEEGINPIEFKHTPSTISIDKNILAKYVGDYDIAGTIIKIYTKNDDKLCLFVKGQPEYELLPTGTNKFSFKSPEGFKVEFTETKDKAIDGVILIQPQGNFNAKKKS